MERQRIVGSIPPWFKRLTTLGGRLSACDPDWRLELSIPLTCVAGSWGSESLPRRALAARLENRCGASEGTPAPLGGKPNATGTFPLSGFGDRLVTGYCFMPGGVIKADARVADVQIILCARRNLEDFPFQGRSA